MNFDTNNVVRSVVIGVVALTVTIPLGSLLSSSARGVNIAGDTAAELAAPTKASEVLDDIRNELTRSCVDYRISKVDSKLERTAKNTIDEYFDGEVSHKNVCDFVLG